MSEEYPLYPALTEQGEIEAQKIMDSFKPAITDLITDIMGKLYTDVSYYVESDHWCNYRNALMDGFKGYTDNKDKHQYDFKELRQAIYDKNKAQIVKDLNQDLVEENEQLKKQIVEMRETARELRQYQ